MSFVRFGCRAELVEGLDPFPNGLWVFIIKLFGDELLRLYLISLENEVFCVHSVLPSEGWNTAGGGHSSPCDKKYLLMVHHSLDSLAHGDLSRMLALICLPISPKYQMESYLRGLENEPASLCANLSITWPNWDFI